MDGDSRSLLLIFILLVFFSAYFSSAESGYYLVNKIRIKNMADDGNKKAKNALFITNNFDSALSAILIGNNIVNIAAASVATLLAMRILKNSTLSEGTINILSTVCTTAIIFLFGEMIPKSLASDRPQTLSLSFARSLRVLMKVFAPLIKLVNVISEFFSRIFAGNESPSITEEELYDIIDIAEEEGVMDEEQSDLIKSAMEFSDITAADVMTAKEDIICIDVSSSNDAVMEAIKNTNHSRIPVYEKDTDNIVGTLPIRGFIKEYYKDPNVDLRSLLIPPFFVSLNSKIDDLLSIMRQHKFYLAIVSDDEGKTVGLVTIEDFLEELVGEIWDEDDVIDNNFVKLGGNKFLVNTRLTVSEVFERMNCDYPSDTHISKRPVLSWIIETFGRIPDEDESFIYKNLEITAKTVENNRVSEVEIRIIPEQELLDESKNEFSDLNTTVGDGKSNRIQGGTRS